MPDAPAPIKVAIADDHEIVRYGVRRFLESRPRFEVVGEAGDGVEAVRIARELKPDVLLLDLAMPRMRGLEALAALQREPVRVVILTAAIERGDLLRAIQLGARAVVLKESATHQLVEAIDSVMAGHYVIDGHVATGLAEVLTQVSPPAPSRYGLTSRELEILVLLVDGASNRDIATRLDISLQTVKHHLTNIFDKTGASTRLELALLALRQRLVPPG